jgi:hypothetical protein
MIFKLLPLRLISTYLHGVTQSGAEKGQAQSMSWSPELAVVCHCFTIAYSYFTDCLFIQLHWSVVE